MLYQQRYELPTFLTEVEKLPVRFTIIVTYTLALGPSGGLGRYSTKDGNDDLIRHLTILGRFGNTAFLVTMYESGELSQEFFRADRPWRFRWVRSENAGVGGLVLCGEERIGSRQFLLLVPQFIM